jgi:undecaprenyl-diphosphatase
MDARMASSASLGFARSFLRWLWHQEFTILVVILCLVAGTWIFIEIADEVVEGESGSFDRMILEQVQGVGPSGQPRGPAWLAISMRDITALGGYTVLTLVTLFCALYLLLIRRRRLAMFTIGAAFGGMMVSSLLKLLFSRERPDLDLRLVVEQSYGFPSGHAMMSAVVYLSLAVILSTILPSVRERALLLLAAMLLTFMVGISRLYLGVHYPTDVLAGWSVGLAWASLWWFVGLRVRNRGTA